MVQSHWIFWHAVADRVAEQTSFFWRNPIFDPRASVLFDELADDSGLSFFYIFHT